MKFSVPGRGGTLLAALLSPSFSGAGVGGLCLGRLQGLTTPQATKMHLQLCSCEESLGQSGRALSVCQLPHLAKATQWPRRTDGESLERAPLLRDRNLVFLSERREKAWASSLPCWGVADERRF